MALLEFEEVKLFIEKEVLVDGKIISPPEGRARRLIEAKAHRLGMDRPPARSEEERKLGELDDWLKAEEYVVDFYEGIIPTVIAAHQEPLSQDSGLKARDRVVSAFRNESIINAFEAAVVGYFL